MAGMAPPRGAVGASPPGVRHQRPGEAGSAVALVSASRSGESRRTVLGWAVGAMTGLLPLGAVAASAPAVLSQPALMTPKALTAAMLAVTRAGARLVAVGERGTVLLSDDHGLQWRQASVPVQVTLTQVRFVDAQQGWATGHMGTVLRTDDGGQHWRKLLDGVAVARLMAASAQASGDAAAIAQAQALQQEGPDKPFFDLVFTDAQRGVVVGAYGLMIATQDGGQTWQPVPTPAANPQGLHLYGVCAAGARRMVVGEQGLLMHSTDGGVSFSALPSPYKGSFLGLLQTHGGELIAHGLRGSVYRASADAQDWQRVDSGTTATLGAGTAVPGGGFALVSQAGEVLVAPRGATSMKRLAVREPVPIAGMALAADGALVMASLRGMRRLAALPLE